MIAVRKVVNLALSKIGAINFGENPDTATSDVVVDILQMMLDEFDVRYANYKLYNESITAKNIITLGTDNSDLFFPIVGDISARPAQITDVVAQIGLVNFPLSIKPFSEYNELVVQAINAIPTTVYIDYGYPFVTLRFFPGFGQSGIVKIIGRGYNNQEGLDINDYLEYPVEWNLAIVSNLANKIADHFGIPNTNLYIQASSDLKHIKQRQLAESMRTLNSDFGSNKAFNSIAGM